MNKRTVIALLEVDGDKVLEDDLDTVDYTVDAVGTLKKWGIVIQNARILDEDDPEDAEAIAASSKIFEV